MFKWIQLKYFKWKVKAGLNTLKSFDYIMRKAGFSRQERRQVWRDVANSSDDRDKVIQRLGKEAGVKL